MMNNNNRREKIFEIFHFNGIAMDGKLYESWDVLVPIVQKIKNLHIEDFSKKKPVMNALMSVDLEELFEAVYQFAKWYNSTKIEP